MVRSQPTCSVLLTAALAALCLAARVAERAWAGEAASTGEVSGAQAEVGTIFAKDQTDMAIDRAIRFLISQQRDDGAIADRQYETTMTSLALMAMASVGIQPVDPDERGRAMRRGLEFVLGDDRQDEHGYFGKQDRSRMYGHGITTLMLTEMLGMGVDQQQDRQILQRCQKAIDLILSAQQHPKSHRYVGGWRYTPTSHDADLSVTVWQLMALRSAKNDGLQVPATAIEQAIEYLKRSYVSTLDRHGMPDDRASGFSYTPGQGRPTFAMTAAGLLAMQVCGQYDSPLVQGAADWLLEHPPRWKERYFFYGTYYYAQGMYQRGGQHAQQARRHVEQLLLETQRNDGSWLGAYSSETRVGSVYATALAVLSLSVKHHYLPIYQK
jgi:hypothetical protein